MKKSKFQMKDERNLFNPDGTPRYIRCYDNAGESLDRLTIVFTKKKLRFTEDRRDWRFIYIGTSWSTEGVSYRGESEHLIDKPSYSHLGKPIAFKDLSNEVKSWVLSEYKDLWDIKE